VPPARTPSRRLGRFPVIRKLWARGRKGPSATCCRAPARPHIDDFLIDLANASKPRDTIRAHHGDLIGFAAHHDGDGAALTTAPVRALLGEIAGQAPSGRRFPPISSVRSSASLNGLLPSYQVADYLDQYGRRTR
jgi:hypothetical protein